MKAVDILSHFLSRSDWVDPAHTVDRVIMGDPNADFDRCVVAWMAGMDTLREMRRQKIRLLVCHEPTFWNHHDQLPAEDDSLGREKVAFIRDSGITIIRNHDCWDRWPRMGIPWAWAQFLGLGDEPSSVSPNGFQHRYDIPPIPLASFANGMGRKCANIGEPHLQVVGGGSQTVSKIGIGTGCACDIITYQNLGCDCHVVCDDGSCYWAGIQRARDLRQPVIRVGHATSEEPGMIALAAYINEHLEGLTAVHVRHGSSYRLAGANTWSGEAQSLDGSQ